MGASDVPRPCGPPQIVNVSDVVFGDGAVAGDGIALGVVAVIVHVSDAVNVHVDVERGR
jgi:hypothetical protein